MASITPWFQTNMHSTGSGESKRTRLLGRGQPLKIRVLEAEVMTATVRDSVGALVQVAQSGAAGRPNDMVSLDMRGPSGRDRTGTHEFYVWFVRQGRQGYVGPVEFTVV